MYQHAFFDADLSKNLSPLLIDKHKFCTNQLFPILDAPQIILNPVENKSWINQLTGFSVILVISCADFKSLYEVHLLKYSFLALTIFLTKALEDFFSKSLGSFSLPEILHTAYLILLLLKYATNSLVYLAPGSSLSSASINPRFPVFLPLSALSNLETPPPPHMAIAFELYCSILIAHIGLSTIKIGSSSLSLITFSLYIGSEPTSLVGGFQNFFSLIYLI